MTPQEPNRSRIRAISSKYDFANAASPLQAPVVWYPSTIAALSEAILHSDNLVRIFRSGNQIKKEDINQIADVVISLKDLSQVTVSESIVTAEAGATCGKIANELAKRGLALPLPAAREKSIASGVIHNDPSSLLRTLGPLADRIRRIHTAKKPGGETVDLDHLDQIDESHIITSIEFAPLPAGNIVTVRFTFPYPGEKPLLTIAKDLFSKDGLPPHCDLVLDAYIGRFDLPLIRVGISGLATPDFDLLRARVEKIIKDIPDFDQVVRVEEFSGSEASENSVTSVISATRDPLFISDEHTERISRTADWDAFLAEYIKKIDQGIGSTKGKPGVADSLASRLQVDNQGGLEVTCYDYSVQAIGMPPKADGSQFHAALIEKTVALSEAGSQGIPGFTGEIFRQEDAAYAEKTAQYASSSHPGELEPFLLAYPRTTQDISTAIQFAKNNQKFIVARSGGHQYSGKSSGGHDTIVLSMDAFNGLQVIGNIVEVGPAVRLTVLANELFDNQITFPHGECPLVAIGGHAQTGGFGHLLRSFGLGLDYVQSFEIVLADGTLHMIQRPVQGNPGADAELFWAVLGGNAGSFGVITKYTLACINDVDHPNSYRYSATRIYNRVRFTELMGHAQAWTVGANNSNFNQGMDFCMTVESKGMAPFNVLLVELIDANLGGAGQAVDGDAAFQSIISAASKDIGFWESFLVPFLTTNGPNSLSDSMNSFVRRSGTTKDGREFPYPYKKRVNSTNEPLTDAFIAGFADLVDEVIHHAGVKLVFQMIIGGGAYRNSARRNETSIPHRDYALSFVFDLFYEDGQAATAQGFQDRMQTLVDTHFSTGHEQRSFWGSFGDTNIGDQQIQNKYYDDPGKYQRLQAVKRRTDPTDVFHSSLTVKP